MSLFNNTHSLFIAFFFVTATLVSKPVTALPLLKTTINGVPDTLEIIVLKFEFQPDETTLTTGSGQFNSDTESGLYSLDPSGKRESNQYWQERFLFAHNYFQNASQQQLAIKAIVYPQLERAYQLPKEMLSYTRIQKTKEEKAAQYDSTRALLYMEFIADAINSAQHSTENPFVISPTSPNTHRRYMILHAGSSQFIDGGSLGTNNADSPGDFIDFFISPEDFLYLKDSEVYGGDTLGIPLGSLDTLNTLMVLSETASQDDLNWGINGILINQIGRSIGIPNTFDIVSGESRLGYFDVMDYAGYNSLNGFLPVLPSAWIRSYMDWGVLLSAQPTSNTTRHYLAAHGAMDACIQFPCSELLKIPITAKEYLLLENRQRSSTFNDSIIIHTISENISIPYLLHHDSLARYISEEMHGAITASNAHDAGIPASGVLIWHINEWLIEETLALGYVNATNGDDISDHYLGVRLIEADGNATLGKAVSGSNFGEPTDVFPHITPSHDTVTTLTPQGVSNTQNSLGALSNISIEIQIPPQAYMEQHVSRVRDTTRTFAAPVFAVDIHWNPLLQFSSSWPVSTFGNSYHQSLTQITHPMIPGDALIRTSQSGITQLLSANGDTISPFISPSLIQTYSPVATPLPRTTLPSQDTLYSFYTSESRPVASASYQKTYVQSYSSGILQSFTFQPIDSSIAIRTASIKSHAPLIIKESTLVTADSLSLYFLDPMTLVVKSKINFPSTPTAFGVHDFALASDIDSDGLYEVIFTSTGGATYQFNSSSQQLTTLAEPITEGEEHFSVCVSDFNRDGDEEAYILGSKGSSAFLSVGVTTTQPKIYSYDRSDSSSAALGDVNRDGYVDLVFTGKNSVWAIDYKGAPLPGFPFYYSSTRQQNLLGYSSYPPGEIASQPLIVDITGDSIPEILSATPDGLLYAVTASGTLSNSPYVLPAPSNSGSTVSGWPIAVAPVTYVDSLRAPYGHLLATMNDSTETVNLYIGYNGFTTGLQFPLSKNLTGNIWLQESGNKERTGHFNASLLPKPQVQKPEHTIEEFYFYPNPLISSIAKLHLSLGTEADIAEITFYDVAGFTAYHTELTNLVEGVNPIEALDISHLGNGVYAAKVKVTFSNGSTATAWDRIGVAR